jgi:hypothetical protein
VTTVTEQNLSWQGDAAESAYFPEDHIIQELEVLAMGDNDVSARAESLFNFLRKISDKERALAYLTGIQMLIRRGEPAGARLLAAFLDVSTPGDRLLPLVQRFTSSRRLRFHILSGAADPGAMHQNWLNRLEQLGPKCVEALFLDDYESDPDAAKPGSEHPWPVLRDTLEMLVARLVLQDTFSPDDRDLMVSLLRVEVDAVEERISLLAGTVNPFNMVAIARTLPLLNRADADVRDLRMILSWISEGRDQEAFAKPLSRSQDILDDGDLAGLRKQLNSDPKISPLADLYAGMDHHPVPMDELAFGLLRFLSLSRSLAREGTIATNMDLLAAAKLVQGGYADGVFSIPLDPFIADAVTAVLDQEASRKGLHEEDLSGMSVLPGKLVITVPEGGVILEHDLPAVLPAGEAVAPVTEDEEKDGKVDPANASSTEIKKLVLDSLMSVSVLLGFLRNPKIIGIPGLVEEVVIRTRSPKIIETICQVRLLHTGFANKGVPLAVLKSPVNVSVKTMRKFIHVKYVNKVDLKRMSKDKGGLRKEVVREIQLYLKTLA